MGTPTIQATFETVKGCAGVYVRTDENKESGTFFIKYYDPDGKRVFEKAEIPRVRMTARKAADLRSDRVRGIKPSNRERRDAEAKAKAAAEGRWTFDRLWKAWQEDPENKGKRGTFKANQRYRKHLKDLFGKREPSDLKPLDIDRLRLSLAADHAKDTTISILGLVTRIARYGASKNYCPGLSFPIVLRGKKLGRDSKVKQAPTDEQFEAYVKACEAWPDVQAGAFQLFIAFTGVRRGSARNLKWADIDFDHRTAVLRDSKTGDVQIVLGDDAVELLRSHPKAKSKGGYVFTGSGPGGMRSQREIDRIPREIADAAKLPADLDPCHSFRRRLATKVEAAHGIATAMKSGGWKSPAMVLNYTATTTDTLRAAANLLGRKASGE